MKKLFFFFLFAFSYGSIAQNLVEKKIINGNIIVDFRKNSFNNSINSEISILRGKIKSDLTYWAFGGQIGLTGLGSTQDLLSRNDIYLFGPAIERGKFIKIIDKFYLAPYSRF